MPLNHITMKTIIALFLLFFFQSSAYQIGDKVGDFKLKNVDGKEISLSQYANSKGVILILNAIFALISDATMSAFWRWIKSMRRSDFPWWPSMPTTRTKSPANLMTKWQNMPKNVTTPSLISTTLLKTR